MIGIIIALIITVVLFIITVLLSETVYRGLMFFMISLLIVNSLILGMAIQEQHTIDPIEVYRGNTSLKITGEYKDSIFVPTDTIVILKNK